MQEAGDRAPTTRDRIDIRRAADRFVTTTDWIEAHHCFSFGDHYDPDNVGYASLLASNDELVTSGHGYDDHAHRDAEIITWVLSGSLVHEDSRGNRGIVYPGLAQRMSAGSGIVHAERNDAYRIDSTHPAGPVHFIQMWLRPDETGGDPSYAQREIDLSDLERDWLPVASGGRTDAAITLASKESTFWVTVLPAGASRVLPKGRYLHLYVARGEVELEGAGSLGRGDSVRLAGMDQLRVSSDIGCELLAWEMGR